MLTDSLRHSVKQALSPNPTPVAQHAIAVDMFVLSAEKAGSLVVAIPVACQSLDDEPYLQAILQAHVEEMNKAAAGPEYSFCEREVLPGIRLSWPGRVFARACTRRLGACAAVLLCGYGAAHLHTPRAHVHCICGVE